MCAGLVGPGSSAKKLIARVRPGVDETFASTDPSSALIMLDLPTFERPRKAISGTLGGGNCAGLVAESKNLTFHFITVEPV